REGHHVLRRGGAQRGAVDGGDAAYVLDAVRVGAAFGAGAVAGGSLRGGSGRADRIVGHVAQAEADAPRGAARGPGAASIAEPVGQVASDVQRSSARAARASAMARRVACRCASPESRTAPWSATTARLRA